MDGVLQISVGRLPFLRDVVQQQEEFSDKLPLAGESILLVGVEQRREELPQSGHGRLWQFPYLELGTSLPRGWGKQRPQSGVRSGPSECAVQQVRGKQAVVDFQAAAAGIGVPGTWRDDENMTGFEGKLA